MNKLLQRLGGILPRREAPASADPGEGFLALARKRYSCRSFSSRNIPDDILNQVLEAGRVAPTACNKQPVKVWVLRSPNAITRIVPLRDIFGAPVVLAVGAKADEAWVRGYDGKNGAEVDAAIVGTHLMLAAADLGLGSVWVGSFDPSRLHALFPEMAGYEVVLLLPLGYPARDAAPNPRHTERKPLSDFATNL